MRKSALMICSLLWSVALSASAAQLGDAAGPLSVKEWIKGEPVKLEALKGNTVAVVEFWATWCPPCRASIPHLTELQKKYKGKAVIIGISNEGADVVKPFVEKMGDKMNYVVAVDEDGKTNKAYMDAYNQQGIPTAFIVDKNGAVVYAGHPMDPQMEATLKKVIEGTFDLAASKAEREKFEKAKIQIREYLGAAEAGGEKAQLVEMGAKLYDAISDMPDVMDFVAYTIAATPNLGYRDLELAARMAEKAVSLSPGGSGYPLHVQARVLFALGKTPEAIAKQEAALKLAAGEEEREELQRQLDEFKQTGK